MVLDPSILLGSSQASKLHEEEFREATSLKGAVLSINPWEPKRRPLSFICQATWFAGNGLNGHSVAASVANTMNSSAPRKIESAWFIQTGLMVIYDFHSLP